MSGLSIVRSPITFTNCVALKGIDSVEHAVFGALADRLGYPGGAIESTAEEISPNIQTLRVKSPSLDQLKDHVDTVQRSKEGSSTSVKKIGEILKAVDSFKDWMMPSGFELMLDTTSPGYRFNSAGFSNHAGEQDVYLLTATDFFLSGTGDFSSVFSKLNLRQLIVGQRILIGDRSSLASRSELDQVFRQIVEVIGRLPIHNPDIAADHHLAEFKLRLSETPGGASSVAIHVERSPVAGGLEVSFRLFPGDTGHYSLAFAAIEQSVNTILGSLK